MDKLTLQLEPRTIIGKKVKNLRKAGLVPASICGKGVANANFQLDAKAFSQVYRYAGRSTLIELQTPQGVQSAFVRQAQIHPVSRQYLHVDFRVVDLRVAMTADVPIVATGENALVERGEGVLSLPIASLHVRALPADLPQSIEVDISTITDFDTTLHVSDLNLGDKVEVLTPLEQPIATISRSRMEAEEEAITEQEQAGEPELSGDDAARTSEDAAEDTE
jgi:large subunit ribosomal protein L25